VLDLLGQAALAGDHHRGDGAGVALVGDRRDDGLHEVGHQLVAGVGRHRGQLLLRQRVAVSSSPCMAICSRVVSRPSGRNSRPLFSRERVAERTRRWRISNSSMESATPIIEESGSPE
jgi:hypothetical protein